MILIDCPIKSFPQHSDTLHRNMFPAPQKMHVIHAYKGLLVSEEELFSGPNITMILYTTKSSNLRASPSEFSPQDISLRNAFRYE